MSYFTQYPFGLITLWLFGWPALFQPVLFGEPPSLLGIAQSTASKKVSHGE